MLQQQINLSPDLKRLRDEGYEVEVKNGYLIVHHIPYVTSAKEVKFGKLISTLSINNNITLKPDTHVINFMGEYPCNKDGSIITAIQHSGQLNQTLFDEIIINFSFSNRPPNGYDNYYDKVVRYVEIITAPAKAIDKSVTPNTFRVVLSTEDDNTFNYLDTNSSRANIYQLNSKFKDQKIAIIGLGGTGSYILDFVSKTPVDKILLFDSDEFLQHNAFRAPGAASIETLNRRMKKVHYFTEVYSQIHKGILAYAENVTEDNIALLKDMSYVFICIDSNASKSKIVSKLLDSKVTFFDVGLGVNIVDNNLIGTLRVTTATVAKNNHITSRIGFEEMGDNEYSSNIQIADLNALNALMAVMKWKKLSGFYQDLKQEFNSTYTINTSQLINEDFID